MKQNNGREMMLIQILVKEMRSKDSFSMNEGYKSHGSYLRGRFLVCEAWATAQINKMCFPKQKTCTIVHLTGRAAILESQNPRTLRVLAVPASKEYNLIYKHITHDQFIITILIQII